MRASHTKKSKNISYVPLYIHPAKYLTSRYWEILPGLRFARIPKMLKEEIKRVDSRTFPRLDFDPNYVVSVEEGKYVQGLARRILSEVERPPHGSKREFTRSFSGQNSSKEAPPGSKEEIARYLLNYDSLKDLPLNELKYPIYVEPRSLARLILVSLLFQQRFVFSMGRPIQFEVRTTGSRPTYTYTGTEVSITEGVSVITAGVLPQRKIRRIDRNRLGHTVETLERYYRPFTWATDRLAFALSSLWNAVTTTYSDQVFISLAIVLEALLSTRRQEITHMLAERGAVLLGLTPTERLKIYRNIKDLYNLRSKIVHGEGEAKKGPITWDSFAISAKMAVVPISRLRVLAELCFRLLETTIKEPDLMSIIQSHKRETKITKELDEFYTRKLMTN